MRMGPAFVPWAGLAVVPPAAEAAPLEAAPPAAARLPRNTMRVPPSVTWSFVARV